MLFSFSTPETTTLKVAVFDAEDMTRLLFAMINEFTLTFWLFNTLQVAGLYITFSLDVIGQEKVLPTVPVKTTPVGSPIIK